MAGNKNGVRTVAIEGYDQASLQTSVEYLNFLSGMFKVPINSDVI